MALLDPIHPAQSAIIAVIGKYPGISVENLRSKLKEEHDLPVSQMNMYKKLKPLIDERVILRDGRRLLVNFNWLMNARAFLDEIFVTYSRENESLMSLPVDETEETVLTFNSLLQLEPMWDHLTQLIVQQSGERERYGYGKYPFFILADLDRKDRFQYTFSNKDVVLHYVIGDNSALSQHALKSYKDVPGIQVHLTKDSPFGEGDSIFTVCGSYVIEIEVDKTILSQFSFFFDSVKDASEFRPELYTSILSMKSTNTLKVRNNPKEAKEIVEKIKGVMS